MSCSVSRVKRGTCGLKPQPVNAMSLADLVDAYLKARPKRCSGKRFSIPEAVFGYEYSSQLPDVLSDSQWNSFTNIAKIDHHQSRPYSKNDLRDIAEYLANKWRKNKFSNFEELYEEVYSILVLSVENHDGKVKDSKALILFDIAVRLAERFNVWPKRSVYLNGNGPFDAANDLGLGKFIQDRKILYADVIKYYPDLAKLDAAQLEDFLCICHSQLNKFKNPLL